MGEVWTSNVPKDARRRGVLLVGDGVSKSEAREARASLGPGISVGNPRYLDVHQPVVPQRYGCEKPEDVPVWVIGVESVVEHVIGLIPWAKVLGQESEEKREPKPQRKKCQRSKRRPRRAATALGGTDGG